MTPDSSDFLTSSLLEIDKYIEITDENFVAAKQTGEVQIKRAMMMAKFSLLCYIMYYLLYTCAIDYFPLIC